MYLILPISANDILPFQDIIYDLKLLWIWTIYSMKIVHRAGERWCKEQEIITSHHKKTIENTEKAQQMESLMELTSLSCALCAVDGETMTSLRVNESFQTMKRRSFTACLLFQINININNSKPQKVNRYLYYTADDYLFFFILGIFDCSYFRKLLFVLYITLINISR